MRIRRQTVEPPFGTLKSWMGATHFLTRTLARLNTEMRLHVLAYNMKRVIKLLGIDRLIDAIRAFALFSLVVLMTYLKNAIGELGLNASPTSLA